MWSLRPGEAEEPDQRSPASKYAARTPEHWVLTWSRHPEKHREAGQRLLEGTPLDSGVPQGFPAFQLRKLSPERENY